MSAFTTLEPATSCRADRHLDVLVPVPLAVFAFPIDLMVEHHNTYGMICGELQLQA